MHRSAYDIVIAAHGKGICKTDIAMAIPGGYYGRVGKRALPPYLLHSTRRQRTAQLCCGASFLQIRQPLRIWGKR